MHSEYQVLEFFVPFSMYYQLILSALLSDIIYIDMPLKSIDYYEKLYFDGLRSFKSFNKNIL